MIFFLILFFSACFSFLLYNGFFLFNNLRIYNLDLLKSITVPTARIFKKPEILAFLFNMSIFYKKLFEDFMYVGDNPESNAYTKISYSGISDSFNLKSSIRHSTITGFYAASFAFINLKHFVFFLKKFLNFLIYTASFNLKAVFVSNTSSDFVADYIASIMFRINHLSVTSEKWVGGVLSNWRMLVVLKLKEFFSHSKVILEKKFLRVFRFSLLFFSNKLLSLYKFLKKIEAQKSRFKGKNKFKNNIDIFNKRGKSVKRFLTFPDILVCINPDQNRYVLTECKRIGLPFFAFSTMNHASDAYAYSILPIQEYSFDLVKHSLNMVVQALLIAKKIYYSNFLSFFRKYKKSYSVRRFRF